MDFLGLIFVFYFGLGLLNLYLKFLSHACKENDTLFKKIIGLNIKSFKRLKNISKCLVRPKNLRVGKLEMPSKEIVFILYFFNK